jgi:hypothetical protein
MSLSQEAVGQGARDQRCLRRFRKETFGPSLPTHTHTRIVNGFSCCNVGGVRRVPTARLKALTAILRVRRLFHVPITPYMVGVRSLVYALPLQLSASASRATAQGCDLR